MSLPPLVKQLAEKKLTRYCERRVPAELSNEIKIDYKIRGNSVTLFESRPYWNDSSKWYKLKIVQFRFNPEENIWTLYCADRNERWHLYIDAESSLNLDDLLREVDKDPTGIFWV